jgi:hypothetical protein
MATATKTPARKTAQKQLGKLVGTLRRASDVPQLLELDESQWQKVLPKHSHKEEPIGELELTDTEINTYLGSMNGVSAKSFVNKTRRMLQKMLTVGLRPNFEGNAFWLKVEAIRSMKAKQMVVAKGSNSVQGEIYEVCVWYEDGLFCLGDIKQEIIYEAETWQEFDDMLRFIPIHFGSKLANGKLVIFDWEHYHLTKKKYNGKK